MGDAFSALDQYFAGGQCGGDRFNAMDQQGALPRGIECDSVLVEHLQIVDAIQGGALEDRILTVFVAATVDHAFAPETKV
jgi:hypothetical protein